ncbi:hypothetical protein chiPu_0002278 [Chiloscyllium punctatum]|uniref:RanBP2-type domain-containing protein n=1 Tax=Chiloscyllium punctatum TaxID=137246 RepID=A0A401S0L5_CHIPU|nr:hypothetical protein [Chiloscyllium punctatum]
MGAVKGSFALELGQGQDPQKQHTFSSGNDEKVGEKNLKPDIQHAASLHFQPSSKHALEHQLQDLPDPVTCTDQQMVQDKECELQKNMLTEEMPAQKDTSNGKSEHAFGMPTSCPEASESLQSFQNSSNNLVNQRTQSTKKQKHVANWMSVNSKMHFSEKLLKTPDSSLPNESDKHDETILPTSPEIWICDTCLLSNKAPAVRCRGCDILKYGVILQSCKGNQSKGHGYHFSGNLVPNYNFGYPNANNVFHFGANTKNQPISQQSLNFTSIFNTRTPGLPNSFQSSGFFHRKIKTAKRKLR